MYVKTTTSLNKSGRNQYTDYVRRILPFTDDPVAMRKILPTYPVPICSVWISFKRSFSMPFDATVANY